MRDWKIKIQDTIADNASSAALVLGGRPTRLHDVDPALIGATLRKNGEIVETGCSGAVLGNPVIAVAWLANKLAQFDVALEPGHVIMPGLVHPHGAGGGRRRRSGPTSTSSATSAWRSRDGPEGEEMT